jgi:hypothetical protein
LHRRKKALRVSALPPCPRVVAGLRAAGFDLVTLDELLGTG